MRDRGHAAVELAMAVAILMLPVVLVVTAFGPWSERRVFAESAAAEVSRAAVLSLDEAAGTEILARLAGRHGLAASQIRLGWCGEAPSAPVAGNEGCVMSRGSAVSVEVHVWVPLLTTPWGDVGGLWIIAEHSEPIDLYRSLDES